MASQKRYNGTGPDVYMSGYQNKFNGLADLYNASDFFPNSGFDTGANITLLDNGTLLLNFFDPGANFPLLLPMLSQLLIQNASRGLVLCSYPLSGQYDHLPRIL